MLTDVGDPARCTDKLDSLLFDLQVYCNSFPLVSMRSDFSAFADRTMQGYAEGITRIPDFFIFLISSDDLDENKVALPAGLAGAVDRLKLS